MKFVYPWMLAFVALVPVAGALWVFLRARAEKRLSSFVAPALNARLMPPTPRLFGLQAGLLVGTVGPEDAGSIPQRRDRARRVALDACAGHPPEPAGAREGGPCGPREVA